MMDIKVLLCTFKHDNEYVMSLQGTRNITFLDHHGQDEC